MPLSGSAVLALPGRYLLQTYPAGLGDLTLIPGAAYVWIWTAADDLYMRIDADAALPVNGVIANDLLHVPIDKRVLLYLGGASRLSCVPSVAIADDVYMQEVLQS